MEVPSRDEDAFTGGVSNLSANIDTADERQKNQIACAFRAGRRRGKGDAFWRAKFFCAAVGGGEDYVRDEGGVVIFAAGGEAA